ncbi:hypothetical protein QR680_018485 [Steinernema hermaphroditum]|uniref:Uncharacterized protein n=1 Tax=Steinernema hermaphroditum TaxID=289476 RepID=A0AA39LR67_9BILA|nr:hypothetical protein QR680_018485 [Steinernema hermaphroditum]
MRSTSAEAYLRLSRRPHSRPYFDGRISPRRIGRFTENNTITSCPHASCSGLLQVHSMLHHMVSAIFYLDGYGQDSSNLLIYSLYQ